VVLGYDISIQPPPHPLTVVVAIIALLFILYLLCNSLTFQGVCNRTLTTEFRPDAELIEKLLAFEIV
jgi:hypothetical protein